MPEVFSFCTIIITIIGGRLQILAGRRQNRAPLVRFKTFSKAGQ